MGRGDGSLTQEPALFWGSCSLGKMWSLRRGPSKALPLKHLPVRTRCHRAGKKGSNSHSISNELVVQRRAPNKKGLCGPCTKASGCSSRALPERAFAQLAASLPAWHSVNVHEGCRDALSNLNTDVCDRSSTMYHQWHSSAATKSRVGPKRAFSDQWMSLALTNMKLFPCQQLKWIWKKKKRKKVIYFVVDSNSPKYIYIKN